MSNHLAAGNAQTPGNQANQNGQNSGAPAPNNNADDTPVVLSAEDIAAQAAADAADAGVPAGDAGDAGDGNRVPQPRFNEVVAERNASMEYANYWRNEALRLMGQGAGGAAAGANAGEPVDEDPEPTLEQHGHDIAKYAPAHSAWVRREIQRGVTVGVTQAMQQANAQQRDQATVGTYQSRAAEFAATKPDFAIVTSNPALQITKPMTAVILQSPAGPAIAYHLATNPAECARIARLDPVQQAAALGKLEAKLEKPAAPAGGTPGGGAPAGGNGAAPRKPSRAPDPPSTTRPGGTPDINMRNCSLSEYLDQRVPQISKMQGRSGGNTR